MPHPPLANRRGTQGQTIIGVLVALVIMLLLSLAALGMLGQGGTSGGKRSIPARVQAEAREVDCMSWLRQCRMAPTMDEDQVGVDSLEDFKGVGELRCPVSGMAYRFDPTRADVAETLGLYCPYPGH